MNILDQIQEHIDAISHGADIDFSALSDLLSQCQDVVRDGLHRSHSASQLPAALQKISTLEAELNSTKDQVISIRATADAYGEQISALEPVVALIRTQAQGRVALLTSIPAAERDKLIAEIHTATYARLAEIFNTTENLTRQAFGISSPATLPADSSQLLNPEQFKTH